MQEDASSLRGHVEDAGADLVDAVLEDMGLSQTPRILILNKLDLVTDSPDTVVGSQGDSFVPPWEVDFDSVVFTSALHGWGIERLREEIDHQLSLERPEFAAASF